MIVELLRHGRTRLQEEGRYVGRTDGVLSISGAEELVPAENAPSTVYVTNKRRTTRTASIVFPRARQVVVQGLEEMDFGRFEGCCFADLEHDEEYRAWLESGCVRACPGGEGKDVFDARVTTAFSQLMESALARGEQRMTVVAHGGTIMAIMARWGQPHRTYFDWHVGCGCGFLLDAGRWESDRALHLIAEVKHTRRGTQG